MSKTGFGSFTGFRSQAAWGTYLAPTGFVEFDEESMKYEGGNTPKPSLRSASQKRSVRKKVSCGGGLTLPFRVQGLEVPLLHALGAVDTTEIVADEVYEHLFSLAQVKPVHGMSCVIKRGELPFLFKYDSTKVTKLAFKQGIEEELMMSLELLGRDEQTSAPAGTEDVDESLEILQWANIATLNVNGVSTPGKVLEFSLEDGLSADSYDLRSVLRAGAPRNAVRKVSGKIELEIDDLTYHALYKARTRFPLDIQWTGSQIGANVGHNYELQIEMPSVELDSSELNVKGAEPIVQALPFTAYWSAAAHDEMTIRLKNGTILVA